MVNKNIEIRKYYTKYDKKICIVNTTIVLLILVVNKNYEVHKYYTRNYNIVFYSFEFILSRLFCAVVALIYFEEAICKICDR